MTLDTLFLMIVTIYLVLIAYGVVGARRRMPGRSRLMAEALMVLLPPVAIAGLLWAEGEGDVVAEWGRLLLLMPVAGALVAVVAEQVAARLAP